MKDHNYYNTFLEVAEDCSALEGTVPQPFRGKPTVAMAHHALLKEPYAHTQQEVLWLVEAWRTGQDPQDAQAEAAFFAPGRACLRANPLTKRYGWGVHFDEHGKAALVGRETPPYQRMVKDHSFQRLKAMRNNRG